MIIRESKILDEIQEEYKNFNASSKTLQQYFNRVIVEAQESQNSKIIYITDKEISGNPIFMVKNKKKNLISRWKLADLRSRNPIKMDIQDIFTMYGRIYQEIDINDPPNFLEIYEMDKNKAIQDQSLPGMSSQTDKIMVALNDGCWYWIPNPEQIKIIYRCKQLPGKCLYHTTEQTNYNDHIQSCTDQTKITSKRRTYGPSDDALSLAIDHGIIPVSFEDYRQKYLCTWDIETLEVESDLTSIQQAIQKIVSVGVASNLPNQKDQFFIRKSSKPEDGQQVVDRFLDELFRLESCYYESIPDEIKEAKEILREVQDEIFSKDRTQRQVLKRFIDNYFTLPAYGFNSGMSY